MTLPVSIGSASHFDQGTDDPKQARAQLKQVRDDLETVNNHLKLSPLISPSTPLGIGAGLESSGGNLRIGNDLVTLAMLAGGTAGKLIGFDGRGDPAEIAFKGIADGSFTRDSIPRDPDGYDSTYVVVDDAGQPSLRN